MELLEVKEVFPTEEVETENRFGKSMLKIKGLVLSNAVDELYAEAVGARAEELEKLDLKKGEFVSAILLCRHREFTDKNNKRRHSNEFSVLAISRFGAQAF